MTAGIRTRVSILSMSPYRVISSRAERSNHSAATLPIKSEVLVSREASLRNYKTHPSLKLADLDLPDSEFDGVDSTTIKSADTETIWI